MNTQTKRKPLMLNAKACLLAQKNKEMTAKNALTSTPAAWKLCVVARKKRVEAAPGHAAGPNLARDLVAARNLKAANKASFLKIFNFFTNI
jgi:hypothetical protein